MHNDLTFFTNEPDRNLYERFSNILNSNTQFFDVLVGYFRTSGFFRLKDALNDVENIRILIGLNVDKKTVEFINTANNETTAEVFSHKEIKENFSEKVVDEFAKSDDSLDIEVGVRTFIDWLKSGKMQLRMYTIAPLHAKVYIMRKDPIKCRDTYGSVITGSSNFSEAGLHNNLEFNVELKDSRDVDFALEQFEKLWAEGVDIKDTYIDAIENKTWLKEDITPYELYLKTLYEFFKEEIQADKDAFMDKDLPNGYMRLQYQVDAVEQARKILDGYGGCFISDVVGLGKTYICAMLAKKLKGKKLVICPPVLVDYWKDVLLEFDVSATVESLGKLDKLIEKGTDDYKYVFIDEAHRFRNSKTENFTLLHDICYNKKVVLISATPINNYSSDIENQLYLFQPKHNSTIIAGVKNLEGFFAKLNGKLKKLKRGSSEYFAELKNNSEQIRDKVLRNVMIRRTRNEIMDYYGDDLKAQGLSFPKLGTPEKIIYTFDSETDEVFKETMNIIKSLDYARYTPLLFLKDNKKYANILVSQKNMSGFMKSILVKRLESSFYAFKMTLDRFIQSYEKFIEMISNGKVYISKKVDVYDLLDNGDDDKLLSLVEDEKVQYFESDEFTDDFMPLLNRDLALLKRLKSHWANITLDPKLTEFINELKNNSFLQNRKMIIFTESKETAEYLGSALKEIKGDRVVVFSGESSEYLKREIENSFNPKMKGKAIDKYDILITTDILAEGINLHRAGLLFNYDLPWNPTKIMQRVGRINRVGTEFDKIYVFNFFPTSQTNAQLPLKDRIIEKLQAFHDTLGEDFKYLSDDEEVSSHKLYQNLTDNLGDEEQGTNPELAYLKEIRQIRDNDEKLFEKIKKLPIKARSSKMTQNDYNSAVTFLRKGYHKLFFETSNGLTKELTFMEAIKLIKSNVEDKVIGIGSNFYELLEANKVAFDDKLTEEQIVSLDRPILKGNDSKIYKVLQALSNCKKLTDDQERKLYDLMSLWEAGDIPDNLTKDILKAIKYIEDPLVAYSEIESRVPNKYFEDRDNSKKIKSTERQVVLSCYLRGANE